MKKEFAETQILFFLCKCKKNKKMRKILSVIVIATILLSAVSCNNATKPCSSELNTTADSASYAIGMRLYEMYASDGLDSATNAEIVWKAFGDKMNDTALLTAEEMEAVLNTFFTKLQEEKQAQQQKEMQEKAQVNIEAGTAFLNKNATREDVVMTESGLQYRVIKEGTGKKPTAESTVSVNYVGKHLDGTVFDSSYDRGEPAEFPLNRVIAGWTEGLQLMNVGSKYEFFIPYNLAYGERGAGQEIGPCEVLVFEVELLEIK